LQDGHGAVSAHAFVREATALEQHQRVEHASEVVVALLL
jgi:hypothetical protein